MLLIACLGWALLAGIAPIQRTIFPDDRTYALAVVGVTTIGVLLGHLAVPRLGKTFIVGAVILALSVLISAPSGYLNQGIQVAGPLVLMLAFTPFVLRYYFANSRAFLPMVLTTFIGVQTFSAVIGILQTFGFNIFDVYVDFGRSRGLAGHPNLLSLMAGIAIVALLYLAIRHKGVGLRIVAIAMMLTNAYAIVTAGSISGMLAASAGCIALLLSMRVAVRASLIFLVIAVVLYFLANTEGSFVQDFMQRISYRLDVVSGVDDTGGAASVEVRGLTYEWAWQQISNNPIAGVGFDDAHAGSFNGTTVVHNLLLRAWAQGGFAYVAWLAAFFLAAAVAALRAIRLSRSAAVSVAVITLVFVYAFSSAFFTQAAYWLPVLLAVAALPRDIKRPTTSTGRPGRASAATRLNGARSETEARSLDLQPPL